MTPCIILRSSHLKINMCDQVIASKRPAITVKRHSYGILVLSYSRVVQIRLMESPSRNDVSQLSEIVTYTESGVE